MQNVTKYLDKLQILIMWFSGFPVGGTGQTQKHGTGRCERVLYPVQRSAERGGGGETQTNQTRPKKATRKMGVRYSCHLGFRSFLRWRRFRFKNSFATNCTVLVSFLINHSVSFARKLRDRILKNHPLYQWLQILMGPGRKITVNLDLLPFRLMTRFQPGINHWLCLPSILLFTHLQRGKS